MKNFATSTVVTPPSPATSGTSLTVQAGHGSRFTAGQATICAPTGTIDPTTAEVVTITPAGDTLTLVRAREGTTARAVQAGDVVLQGVTAGMWDQLSGGVCAASTTETADFTAAAGTVHLVDAAAGPVTASLPDGAAGQQTRIVNAAATGTVTVAAPASAPGGVSVLLRAWESATLACTGVGSWVLVG